jgi:hypothetical protein
MIELTIFNNGPLKPKTCVFSDFLIILWYSNRTQGQVKTWKNNVRP